MFKKKYDPDYEDGKCPVGFEYVKAYTDPRNGRWVESYCRKVPRHQSRKDKQYEQNKEDAHNAIEQEGDGF